MQTKGDRRKFTDRKHGRITIGGKSFYCRSSWEANLAAYLEFQKQEGRIKDWSYEPETFWFLKIMRGIRSYKPDFKVFETNGDFYFIELKGFLDDESKTKLKRMKKYHPNIKLHLYDAARYKQIEQLRAFIPNWGLLDK